MASPQVPSLRRQYSACNASLSGSLPTPLLAFSYPVYTRERYRALLFPLGLHGWLCSRWQDTPVGASKPGIRVQQARERNDDMSLSRYQARYWACGECRYAWIRTESELCIILTACRCPSMSLDGLFASASPPRRKPSVNPSGRGEKGANERESAAATPYVRRKYITTMNEHSLPSSSLLAVAVNP